MEDSWRLYEFHASLPISARAPCKERCVVACQMLKGPTKTRIERRCSKDLQRSLELAKISMDPSPSFLQTAEMLRCCENCEIYEKCWQSPHISTASASCRASAAPWRHWVESHIESNRWRPRILPLEAKILHWRALFGKKNVVQVRQFNKIVL